MNVALHIIITDDSRFKSKQEKLFGRKCTIRVTHRSQNIQNTWAFLSFKVDMTFTLNDIDPHIDHKTFKIHGHFCHLKLI